MKTRWMTAALVVLGAASAAQAQSPAWRFQWQTGQVLMYKVDQVTTAYEILDSTKSETTSKLNSVKRWQVLGVEPNGVATLQLSLASLRLETKPPEGDALIYDSTAPDKSNPQLRDQMARYLGAPLATLRVDARGQIVEVKETRFGDAAKYATELPFVLTLPATGAPAAGQTWERPFTITLKPPQGTNDAFQAVQACTCKGVQGTTATVGITTTIKNLPAAVADQAPLLQYQPQGDVVFDLAAGRMQSARLTIDRELPNHQGEGTSYRIVSSYAEQYIGSK